MKTVKICIVCLISFFCLAGCGERTKLKNELESVELTYELPEPGVRGCSYLSEADEAVYRQQISACAMYSEAYNLTKTADYTDKYGADVKEERIAYYCRTRRTELNESIKERLRDNVYDMIKSVEDCQNISAYLDRVNDDALTFFDYYDEYVTSEDKNDIACKIMKTFYERSNILAFEFMAEHKGEILTEVIDRILENASATDDYNMYIVENNELIKAINSVYGGLNSENAALVTQSNTKLIRNMLENDNELDSKSIDLLMEQLGEETPNVVF